MTPQETTILLGFIQGLDNRFVPDQKSISAWMNVLPSDITLDQAMGYVKEHYLEHDRSVMPANIVGRHRVFNGPPAPAQKPGPSHDCLEGWILLLEDRDGKTVEVAAKCPQCTNPSSRLKS